MHINGRNKNILVLSKGPTQGLDNSTITAETKYPINFTKSKKRFVLSLCFSASNGFLFVNAMKIYQFKAQDSEIKPYTLCVGKMSNDFMLDNVKKTGLKGIVKVFSVDYDPINTSDILDIHRFLMRET